MKDQTPPAVSGRRFDLQADRKGAVWDLLLYVPVVVVLALIGARLWFDGERAYAYLLSFLASFFFFVGANRIVKTRLMWLPSAPRGIEFGEDMLWVLLRSGTRVELVKEQKLYTDMAGRSFGVSGLDRGGRRLQFVFHRGQFAGSAPYEAAQEALRRLQGRR
jgi:hypothetical protein